MKDELHYKRVIKNGRKGIICNPVEVTVRWDDGDVTREKLRNLEFFTHSFPFCSFFNFPLQTLGIFLSLLRAP